MQLRNTTPPAHPEASRLISWVGFSERNAAGEAGEIAQRNQFRRWFHQFIRVKISPPGAVQSGWKHEYHSIAFTSLILSITRRKLVDCILDCSSKCLTILALKFVRNLHAPSRLNVWDC